MPLLRNTGQSTLPLGNNPTAANSEGRLNQMQTLGVTKKFTPTWFGFGVGNAPVGDISYINMGAIALVFATNPTGANLTGTSNANDLYLTGMPKEIWPRSTNIFVECALVDNGVYTWGGCAVDGSGGMQFLTYDTTFAVPTFPWLQNGFTNVNAKGLPDGWFIIYPLV